MKNPILAIGSVAFDSVKTSSGKVERALGGSAVHFSLAASHFTPVSLLGVVGHDFPHAYKRLLTGKGVNIDGLAVVPGKTFHWAGSYDKYFKNALTHKTELNVFGAFNPILTPKQRTYPVLFLANIDPELQLNILRQMRRPVLAACDTMNFWISGKRRKLLELLRHIDIFFINEEEIRQLTGEYNLIEAGIMVLGMGPEVVVIKKGDNGSLLLSKRAFLSFPAYPIRKVVDPTGAGDSFAGGFIGYLATVSNWRSINHLRKAMAYGTVVSSFNVEDFSVKKVCGLTGPLLNRRYCSYVKSLRIA